MINICLEDALNSVFCRIQTRAVIIDGQSKVADNPKLGKRRGLGFVMWLLAEDEWKIYQVHEFTYDLFNKSYLPQCTSSIDQYFYFNNNINTITKGNMWTICAFDNYIALSQTSNISWHETIFVEKKAVAQETKNQISKVLQFS